MFDVVAFGELLIDFTPVSTDGTVRFEQNPGGAPANVAVAVANLGLRASFMGQVGDDPFGHFLSRKLHDSGVDTQGLRLTPDYHTTLAFVHLDDTGDRSFSFYRTLGADMMLEPEELNLSPLNAARLFHFGSVSMTGEPIRTTTKAAVSAAKRGGAVISFDPNIRLSLWSHTDEVKPEILSVMDQVDVLKVSEEELESLTGQMDTQIGVDWLLSQFFNLRIILVTRGPAGCIVGSRHVRVTLPGFPVNVVDTTGAGDAFMGAFLGQLIESGKRLEALTESDVRGFAQFANAAGALATTRRGGIPSLPTRSEVSEFLSRQHA